MLSDGSASWSQPYKRYHMYCLKHRHKHTHTHKTCGLCEAKSTGNIKEKKTGFNMVTVDYMNEPEHSKLNLILYS